MLNSILYPASLVKSSKNTILITILILAFASATPVGANSFGSDRESSPSPANKSSGDGVTLSYVSYLPIISHHGSIYGYVTEDALPVAGVSLELRLYDQARWYTIASTITDWNGFYTFPGAPSLESGQHYMVWYHNDIDPDRLYSYHTKDLDSYTAFTSEYMGTFDVSNVELVSPPSGSIVSLPYTFQWIPRSPDLNDNYELVLFDPLDQNPLFSTYPGLGHVGSYTLESLPPEFENSYTYTWRMWLLDPDDPLNGGTGLSFYRYEVQFDNLK